MTNKRQAVVPLVVQDAILCATSSLSVFCGSMHSVSYKMMKRTGNMKHH